MEGKEYTSIDQLPLVLSVAQLAAVLGIGINSAYQLVRSITPELEHRKSGYVERKRRPYQGNVVRIA